MNHTADIRSVRPGDAPQLAHIQTESWKAAFREIIPADILSEYTDPEPVTRMYEHLLTHGSAHGYILERDGAPHGIAWWDAAREPDMAGTAELICIHSLPAHWHQGYGKLLLEKVLRDVKSAGYPSILLWVFDANLPAIRFYRSLGFTASGRKRPSFGSVERRCIPRPSDPRNRPKGPPQKYLRRAFSPNQKFPRSSPQRSAAGEFVFPHWPVSRPLVISRPGRRTLRHPLHRWRPRRSGRTRR